MRCWLLVSHSWLGLGGVAQWHNTGGQEVTFASCSLVRNWRLEALITGYRPHLRSNISEICHRLEIFWWNRYKDKHETYGPVWVLLLVQHHNTTTTATTPRPKGHLGRSNRWAAKMSSNILSWDSSHNLNLLQSIVALSYDSKKIKIADLIFREKSLFLHSSVSFIYILKWTIATNIINMHDI